MSATGYALSVTRSRPMLTAAEYADLPGFRPDRADWSVVEEAPERGSGPCFRLMRCGCGGQYLRALGVRGRPREYCSDLCKNVRPEIRRFRNMIEAFAAQCAENGGGDDTLLDLKAELLAITSARPFQAASGRRGARALKAKRAKAKAAREAAAAK